MIPTGDQGGPVTNGQNHTGTIEVGDLDIWTFDAQAGDTITLTMTELAPLTDFYPRMVLIGPDGATVTFGQSETVARIDRTLALTGTYQVIVSSNDFGNDATGNYRLILAKPGAFVVPTGDQGGAIASGGSVSGAIDTGDIDLWTFTAVAGQTINLTISELAPLGPFYPTIQLIGPNGAQITSGRGETTATITRIAPLSGTYTVLVSSGDTGNDAAGAYQLSLAITP